MCTQTFIQIHFLCSYTYSLSFLLLWFHTLIFLLWNIAKHSETHQNVKKKKCCNAPKFKVYNTFSSNRGWGNRTPAKGFGDPYHTTWPIPCMCLPHLLFITYFAKGCQVAGVNYSIFKVLTLQVQCVTCRNPSFGKSGSALCQGLEQESRPRLPPVSPRRWQCPW